MMPDGPSDRLDRARHDAQLSITQLWMRYFELGGMATALELEAYLYGALQPTKELPSGDVELAAAYLAGEIDSATYEQRLLALVARHGEPEARTA